MKQIIIIFAILLPILSIGQDRINYLEFPKNSISVAPTNIFFDGNGNTLFYKRRLSQSEDKLKYLRIGTEFFGVYKFDDQASANNYSLNIGIENLKKLSNFSLSSGYELALNYYSADDRHVEPTVNSIFLPQSAAGSSSNPNIDRGTFFMTSIIGFIGIKYHFTEHFAIGLESGVGIGYYRSIDKFNSGMKSSSGGVIIDIDPSRQFTIEYFF